MFKIGVRKKFIILRKPLSVSKLMFSNFLSKKTNLVVPGDQLIKNRLNVCLTFDDAYFDFFKFAYPLLLKYKIKATLAIPVKYILDETDINDDIRLNTSYKEAHEDIIYKKKAPFCTYKELLIMKKSNFLNFASHSYSHQNLLNSNIDLKKEIIESKQTLIDKLGSDISTFVYPLGKFNENINNLVKSHYKYAFRIGSALNFSWQNFSNITYRVLCDNIKNEKKIFSLKNFISYFWFYYLNTFRGR